MRVAFLGISLTLLTFPGVTQAELLSTRPDGIKSSTLSTLAKGAIQTEAPRVARDPLLSTRPPEQRKPKTRQVISTRSYAPGIAFDVHVYSGKHKGDYVDLARKIAKRHGIPQGLFLRLVQQESAFNPRAVSHKGAIGLAQLMPGTAHELGVNPYDPAQNLEGGARYLQTQFQRFGSWRLALAAYNAGPGAVIRHDGIPPFRETRNYVRKIWGY